MCRWMNGDLSFVSARTKEDAIGMLDEWDNAEGAEISQIRDFMVDFRLNDEGDLELVKSGERCRDAILEKAYPRLLKAMIGHIRQHGFTWEPECHRVISISCWPYAGRKRCGSRCRVRPMRLPSSTADEPVRSR